MNSGVPRPMEERKRILELILFFVIVLVLIGISRLETRLFVLGDTLSQHPEISTTITYFALINVNVILVLALSFLIFRNIAKLVLERRRGVLGSKLRTKLVVSLVFFALAPTLLLFYVSMRFVTTSFGEWFSDKVTIAMQQTREAGAAIYEQDEKRMRSLANIAMHRIEIVAPDEIYIKNQLKVKPGGLPGFDSEYGLTSVQLFNARGSTIWTNSRGYGSEVPYRTSVFVVEAFAGFASGSGALERSTVESENNQDVVKGIAAIIDPFSGELLGAVLAQERFQTQILKSVEKIIADFAVLKPGAQLIRLSYLILMVLMTLLITFAATWMGFYVARGITGPLQSLAEATREVALGNYAVSLQPKTDDETGQLVKSFNMMTRDLEKHQELSRKNQLDLQSTNLELDQRRQYMEIVLKNITGGVMSVDKAGKITSINRAAERLLEVDSAAVNGLLVSEGLGTLYLSFWQPVFDGLKACGKFHGQLEVSVGGTETIMIADAVTIADENDIEVGYVVVFDDAREQAKAQKVAAWREVARRIAHEIKNPITPIKLNAQRLLRKFNNKFTGEDHEVFESCIEIIIKQVDSLRDLVNEFSKFSRLPSVELRSGNLNQLIDEVVDLFFLSYPEVELDKSELNEIPEIPLDLNQMGRVLLNLVTNAVSALDESRPGRIAFKSELIEKHGKVRLEISDNGQGIPDELKERVLEPYFSTKDEGTGLGLAIVNQIIVDHGGYMRLADNKPHGTIVILELPLWREGASSKNNSYTRG